MSSIFFRSYQAYKRNGGQLMPGAYAKAVKRFLGEGQKPFVKKGG